MVSDIPEGSGHRMSDAVALRSICEETHSLLRVGGWVEGVERVLFVSFSVIDCVV